MEDWKDSLGLLKAARRPDAIPILAGEGVDCALLDAFLAL